MNAFTIRISGNIGQEIISPQGKILVWTTDPVIGEILVRYLNKLYSNNDPITEIFGREEE